MERSFTTAEKIIKKLRGNCIFSLLSHHKDVNFIFGKIIQKIFRSELLNCVCVKAIGKQNETKEPDM